MTAMQPFFDRVFNIERYPGRAGQDQARLIYGFTVVMMVLFLLFALFIGVDSTEQPLFAQIGSNAFALIPVIGVFGVGIATLALTRMGRADIASYGPALMWYLSGVLLAFRNHFLFSDSGAALMLLIFLAALFLRVRGLVLGTAVALITLLIGSSGYAGEIIAAEHYSDNTWGLAFQIIGASVLIYFFLRSTQLDRAYSATSAYDERFKLANVTTQIAQRISRRTALSDMLNLGVEDILESYGNIYHVQIFLVNEQTHDQAALVASTGDVGKVLLQNQHRLQVGGQSVVGQVTLLGEAIIARAGTADSIHRRNELLPETIVEAAFPLKIGDRVIGALDLQSRFDGAFAPDDVPIFQSLADNLAVAIDNARLFEQTEQRLQENQRLIEQMRGAVREVERLNRELTQQVWTQFLGSRGGELGIDVDFSNNVTRRVEAWTPTLNEAVKASRLVQKQTRDGVTVSVPLRVRGLIVGAMEFEVEGEALSVENLDLVNAVAERFGLAVESTRLYEESRRVAQRESMLNEIGGRLQRTNSIDAVLTEAARGLQSSLGASRVAIRLGAPPTALENGGD